MTERPVNERTKRRIVLALGTLVVLLVGIGGPLWTARAERLSAPVGVAGTITDQRGVPLAHISVQVYRWEHRQWEALNAMNTDARGRYRFTGMPAGRFTVAFEDESGIGYLECWWGGGLSAAKARYLKVAAGTTATMNSRVILGAAITGRATVSDPDRGTIDATQFSVTAYPVFVTAGGVRSIRWTAGISSLDPVRGGEWRIQYLRTGSYVLQAVDNDEYPALNAMLGPRWVGAPASKPYSLGEWTSAEVFRVEGGRVYPAPRVNLTYLSRDPQPALVLRVVDGAGQPIRGARVDLRFVGASEFTFHSGMHGAPFTDANGVLGVYRATPGEYELTITARGFATLTEAFEFRQGQSGTSSTTVVLN